ASEREPPPDGMAARLHRAATGGRAQPGVPQVNCLGAADCRRLAFLAEREGAGRCVAVEPARPERAGGLSGPQFHPVPEPEALPGLGFARGHEPALVEWPRI